MKERVSFTNNYGETYTVTAVDGFVSDKSMKRAIPQFSSPVYVPESWVRVAGGWNVN